MRLKLRDFKEISREVIHPTMIPTKKKSWLFLGLVFCIGFVGSRELNSENKTRENNQNKTRELLDSALRRAKAECHFKLEEGWSRHAENTLKLDYTLDPGSLPKENLM